MAIDRTPVLKRSRSLDMDPVYLGVKNRKQKTSTVFKKYLSETTKLQQRE